MNDTPPDSVRALAVRYNNLVWKLLEQETRTEAEDDRMVHAAHASLMAWLEAGTAVNEQRGLWLVARVYSELGHGGEAVRYAKKCWTLTEQAADLLEGFDRAYGLEALARSHAVAGDQDAAARRHADALKAAEALPEEDSRRLVLADIAAGNWGGFSHDD